MRRFVAIAVALGLAGLGAGGSAAMCDVKGGRYVSGVVDLVVGGALEPDAS